MNEPIPRYTYVHHPYYGTGTGNQGSVVVAVDMSTILAHISQLESGIQRIADRLYEMQQSVQIQEREQQALYKHVEQMEQTLKNEVYGKLPRPAQAQRCPECEIVRPYEQFPSGDYVCQECRGVE